MYYDFLEYSKKIEIFFSRLEMYFHNGNYYKAIRTERID